MTDILDSAAEQMHERKIEEANKRLKELEKELGVTYEAIIHATPQGIMPYIAILPDKKGKDVA